MPNDNNILNFLNLKEEDVEESSIHNDGNIVYFDITLKRKECKCPNCFNMTKSVKDYSIKLINHTIFNDGRSSKIRYKQRRYYCSICKKSFVEDNPFTKANDKVSRLIINNVIEKLKDPCRTYESIAKELNISSTEVIKIFDENINYERLPFPKYLCIDEFHCSSTNSLTRYACFFLDFDNNKVIEVLKSRRKDYLINFLSKLPIEERKNVLHVCIDMWPTYKDVAKLYLPNAVISIDSFHVIQDIQKYLDSIRLDTMRKFDTDSKEYYLLKHFHWLLTKKYKDIKYNEPLYNKKLGYYVNHFNILELILDISRTLKAAYEWKEKYCTFNDNCNFKEAPEQLDQLISDLKELKILKMEPIIKTLKKWRQEIINSFIKYENIGRIHNGKIEGRNNTNKKLQRVSNGLANFKRYRNRIFHCINNK